MEAGGWLVLAFEHVRARHADYTPGSPDLDVLAKIIDSLQAHPLPDVLERKRIERRWESMGEMSATTTPPTWWTGRSPDAAPHSSKWRC